jgi:hypothetical protein
VLLRSTADDAAKWRRRSLPEGYHRQAEGAVAPRFLRIVARST